MTPKIQYSEQLELFPDQDSSTVVGDDRPDFALVSQSEAPVDRRTQYSPELVESAMALYRRGVSYKTAACSLGIPVYTAREWQHRYRNHTLEQHATGRSEKGKYSASVKEKVIQMRLEKGMSYNRIVQETGISRATIRSWLVDIGQSEREEQNPMLNELFD